MKKIKFSLDGIFPVPIYRAYNIKKITKSESGFVEKQKSKVYKNEGNTTTLDTYILEQPIFKNLKNIVKQHLNLYLKNVLCPLEKNTEIYITQSWLNYTNFRQYHHSHLHSNSFISGVFYFKASKKFDKIYFYKPPQSSILDLTVEDYNLFNSKSWHFEVNEAMIIIFPSTTLHHVKLKEDSNERISLSFNTFVKGNIGDLKSITQLKL